MQFCKRLIIFQFLVFCSVQAFAQSEPDVTGLWKGTMFNDTTGQFLKYEIAISEKKGKLYGFTHTYFIVDDREYHGVKKVKIKRQDGKIIVEDLELIANNYPIPPNKGVKQLDVLTLEMGDGIMTLAGPFSTRRTKQYHSLTGRIDVQRIGNFRQSALVPHLEELGLVGELSFVQEVKAQETTVVAAMEKEAEQPIVKTKPVEKEKPVKVKAVKENKQTEITVPEKELVKTEKPVAKKEPEKTKAPAPEPTVNINNRIIETIQSVNYSSDSLVLTLYDNGEVDGDTVSVLMNGEVIMPHVGLSTNAVRKVIYTKDLPETIQIVMYAETLGSLPPNTGLLIVYDGKDRYEIRFSGDLKKNAAIEFKRKSPL